MDDSSLCAYQKWNILTNICSLHGSLSFPPFLPANAYSSFYNSGSQLWLFTEITSERELSKYFCLNTFPGDSVLTGLRYFLGNRSLKSSPNDSNVQSRLRTSRLNLWNFSPNVGNYHYHPMLMSALHVVRRNLPFWDFTRIYQCPTLFKSEA